MTDRVILQRSISELMDRLHESILKYAAERAGHHDCDVYLCVNTKPHGDRILERIFDRSVVNKLKSNETVEVYGRKMSLHTTLTLNKIYLKEGVYLLFFPVADLLKAVEYQSSKNTAYEIIVFTEADEHTEATDQWMYEYDVRTLQNAKE